MNLQTIRRRASIRNIAIIYKSFARDRQLSCKVTLPYLNDSKHEFLISVIEKDASKRLKTECDSIRGSSTSGGSIGASGTTSGTVSGSDSQPGSEPPPSRQQRMGSSASTAESYFSPTTNGMHHGDEIILSPRNLSYDELNNGRSRGLSSPTSRDTLHHLGRRLDWGDNQRIFGESVNGGSAWFDPRGIQGTMVQSPENGPPSSAPSQSLGNGSGRGSRSSGSGSMSRPPSLKTEQSSSGSISSLGSFNVPRTPSDASLPIHALLSSKPEPPYATSSTAQSQFPMFQTQSGRPLGDQLHANNAEAHSTSSY